MLIKLLPRLSFFFFFKCSEFWREWSCVPGVKKTKEFGFYLSLSLFFPIFGFISVLSVCLSLLLS